MSLQAVADNVVKAFRQTACLALSLISVFSFVITTAKAMPSWQVEWKKTVEAAKKEGQVYIVAGPAAGLSIIQPGVFQKRFPEIKVVSTVGRSQVPRIMAERRAGKYIPDVIIGGGTTVYNLYKAKALDSIRDAMILPEIRDESLWWRGKHHYMDPERKYALAFIGIPDKGNIYYNTDLVNPKEIQSYWDFVNPKWRGKITARDIRTSGVGTTSMRIFYYNPRLGPEFIRKLFGEMDITLFRDGRQGVNWLATGKIPICFFCTSSAVARAKGQGLPIGEFGFMKEGAGFTSSVGNINLANRAPHPNAAKVFINWLLSREGQVSLQQEAVKHKLRSSNSLRIDIPKDIIPPRHRLVEGVEYTDVDTPERISNEPIRKVVNKALAEAKERRR